jgi:hypothetical protein
MFEHFLSLAGYVDVSSTYNKEQLLQTAHAVCPGRVENVEQQRSSAFKTTRWSVINPKLIIEIDWVFGLDAIIEAASGVRFGFDVTLNPEKVASKVEKMRSFAPLWKALGVSKVAVVLLVPPAELGLALLSDSRREQITDELLEQVIYALDDQQVEVRSYVLAF